MVLEKIKERIPPVFNKISGIVSGRGILVGVAAIVIFFFALGMYWSIEPGQFSVRGNAEQLAAEDGIDTIVPGYTTTATLYRIADTLLTKPGGYLKNDIMPPGVFLDNMMPI